MAKRLNDTAGIAAMPMSDTESSSVSIRPISNGYLKCMSSHGQHGYNYTETYHAEKPRMDGTNSPDNSGNSMQGAVAYLKRTDAI